MSMIPCNRACVSQQDGYCSLEGITRLSDTIAAAEAGCLYYNARLSPQAKKQDGGLLQPPPGMLASTEPPPQPL